MAQPYNIYVNRYRETAPDLLHWIRTRLDRARCFEPSLRGLHDLLWAADCTSKSLAAIAQTRHDTSDGAGGGWGCPDTGREFRHGKKRAQTRIPNCKRRCDACGEFPGASAIVPRHGLVLRILISNANSLICPAHPTHLPLLSTRCALLHGIGMELLNGSATLPTTTNLPIVRQAGWSCWSLEPPPTPPPPFPVFSVVARGYSAMP